MTPETETLLEQEPSASPVMDDSPGEHTPTAGRRPLLSVSKPKLLKRAAIGIAAVVVVVPGVLSLVLYLQMSNMAIRLNSLEAAFRSGQLSQLSSSVAMLEKRMTEQDEQDEGFALKEGVVSGMKQLGNTLDMQIAAQNQKIEQLSSQLSEQKKALQYELDNSQASALDISSLKARIDALNQVHKPATAPVSTGLTPDRKNKKPAPKKPKRSVRIVPLAAPFILTGIEQRGGQNFAVVAPTGATSLSQMQLLSPGDSAWGWQLRSIEGNEAVFSVNGIPQRLTAQ
ncbi:plasmid transfer protein [Rahnella sp. BCC 1045]|uniref:plasmid transfer protein n=1 Tax=Rahnella sp. BCC 1045 TaxID=2816251 RepID=UPI001C273A17|nr:plasmid transfer protein [Rahnella sp. BCC 1045]MBU9819879.1 plasmid transfer protein [Rahnella sp. BCC 1045]